MEENNTSNQYVVSVLIITPKGVPLVRDPKKPEPRYWKLPGGRSEIGEKPLETAIREAKEETGLDLDPMSMDLVYSEERENHDFYLFQSVAVSLNGFKDAGNEGEEVKLFTPDEIKTLPDFFPAHKEILEEIKF